MRNSISMQRICACATLALALAATGAPAETIAFVDSQGDVTWVDTENPGVHGVSPSAIEHYGKAGAIAFTVQYDDVSSGFNDPTYGAARRARVTDALTYLNTVLDHTGACDVHFLASQSDGTGALATGGTYYSVTPGFTNGYAFRHITTGSDPSGSVADIEITVDFGWNWYTGTGTPSGQIDFLSVMTHELTHGLGFSSLTANQTGASGIGTGIYAFYDSFLATGNGKVLFSGNPPSFQGVSTDLLGGDNGVRFFGPNAVAVYGSRPVIYAPSSWQGGSSIAHLDPASGPAVMEPSISNNEVQRTYAAVEKAMLNDIGYAIQGLKFTRLPIGGWFEEGNSTEFVVECVDAVGSVDYQWTKDGSAILGETTDTLLFAALATDDTGYYTCQASDESKALYETQPVWLEVFPTGSLPALGTLGLLALSSLYALAAARRLR